MNVNDTSAELLPIRKIAPGIYQIQIPLSNSFVTDLDHMNAYLIEGTHGWLLIDVGWNTPAAQSALEAALKSLNLTFNDIRSIVATHSHPDHFGLAGKIQKLSPQIEIYMHRWESEITELRYNKWSEYEKEMSILLKSHGTPAAELEYFGSVPMPALEFVTMAKADQVLYGGEIIHTGLYDIDVIWTPGHSPGHICLYEPKNQILFSGDHILPTITPNISYYTISGDNPLGDYICALGKLINLPIKQVQPGHEYSFTDLKGRVKAILEHHQQREIEIQKVIADRLYDAYQIASRISWNTQDQTWDQLPPMQKRLATSETISHLEHLRWEGKLRRLAKDDRIFYSLV